ncbi:MAG: sigma-54 dependent transcriptional regulator [Paracoccaceae bacterium]|nr:sigma-54 dependent transcriptional regulator [Paracoccaceae bacterium]
MGYILVVDDEKDIRQLLGQILSDEGYKVCLARNSESAMNEINENAPDLIILDIWLKDSHMDGIEILKTVRSNDHDIPVVVISGHGNIEIAVAAVKQGAYDFLEKPFNSDQLLVVIRRALEASRLRREITNFRRNELVASNMVGDSTSFKTLRTQLDKVTRSNGRVMLSGPAGSGKEIAARYIHINSHRAKAPFVSVSCANIEPNKMEEVLFGTEFDGNIKPGLLEKSNGGILFFDEVADMPLRTQSKILRVLVEQTFSRVGGNDLVRVDLRVISSTSKNLVTKISAGEFREELFHRLNVVPIKVPSLESRREDIPILTKHFTEQLRQTEGLPHRLFSEGALTKMQTMPWPGNLRQLRNAVEQVLILGPENMPVEALELPEPRQSDKINTVNNVFEENLINLSLRDAREVFEREYLMTQINRFGGNISKTAIFVGMERSALHRKMKTLSIVSENKSSKVVD